MVRWALLILLVAAPALARPKAAVAPLDGDDDQKVANVVADAAGDHAKVTGPDKVARAMDHLSITTFKSRDLKKLRSNLEVDVVIHGAVTKNGSKKHLELTISGKGKQKETVELDFKTTKALKKPLAAMLGKKLDAAAGGGNDDDVDDDDDDKAKSPFGDSAKSDDKPARGDERHASDDDDRPKKHDDDDKPKRHASDDEDRPKKHASDDDRPKKHDDDDRPRKRTADADVRKHSDDDDDDRPRRRKHHRGDDDDDGPPRNPITQAAAWVDAGGNFTRHTLTWTGSGMNVPPGVGTAAASAAIDGELYPGSFSTLKGGSAAIGVYGAYQHAMGLGIAVPGANVTAPIKQDFYQIGARYRLVVGKTSSVAFGAAYWRRTYVADRSDLMMATLDTPDISYKAVAPGISARIAAGPKVGVVLQADVPLMLDGGPIVKGTSYGAATILAFDLAAGLQILVAPHVALQLRGDFNRDAFSFAAKAQSQAAIRGVTGATDMNYGLTATLGLLY